MENFYGEGSNCPEKYISIYNKIKQVYPEERKISLFYQVGDFMNMELKMKTLQEKEI